MKKAVVYYALLAVLAACHGGPVQEECRPMPGEQCVIIDEYAIYVTAQGGNVWAAHGGERGGDGVFIPYRQKRAIEVQSGCRIRKVLSSPRAGQLRALVHRCAGHS